MEKLSGAQIGQMMKVAADSLRSMSAEIVELKEKVAQFEHQGRAEKIASQMEEKGLQPELSYEEKVTGLLGRDNLDVVEEAIGMSAPQLKLASVHEEGQVTVEGDNEGSSASNSFAAALAGMD